MAGFAPRDFWTTRVHPIPPSLFTCNFVWVDATPENPAKIAFCRPPETRITCTDGPLTLQTGLRYPHGRACPVGWPSAAPVSVDAGHPVWGGRAAVWGNVGTLPYKVILGVRLIQTRHKISFWRIISLITLHNPGLYGNVPGQPPRARRLEKAASTSSPGAKWELRRLDR